MVAISSTLKSKTYILFCAGFAALSYALDREAQGLIAMLLFASVILILESDVVLSYPPVLFGAMSVLRLYDSFNLFMGYVWAGVIAIAALVLHFVLYPPGRKEGRGALFFPYLAVSLALVCGGLGVIGVRAYFSPTALYYTLGLGLGMLAAYGVFRHSVNLDNDYDAKEYLAFLMFVAGAFAVFMIGWQYCAKVVPALLGPPFTYNVIERFFTMSNNVCTYILMMSPFSFYLAARKKYGVLCFAIGVLQGFAMLLSTSRSGFFFSFALILPLVVRTVRKDPAKRKHYLITLAAIVLLFAIMIATGYRKIWVPLFDNYAFRLSETWVAYTAIVAGATLFVSYLTVLYGIKEKLRRYLVPATAAIMIIFCVCVLIFWDNVAPFITRLDRSRGGMVDFAVQNFLRYPLFGTGLGYGGTEEFYTPRTGAMHFYHSAPFQILGSLGLAGVLAYGYMLFSRLRLLRRGNTEFHFTVFFCTIGLYLMSLVNPGIFVPLLFMLQLTLYYAVVEKEEDIIFGRPQILVRQETPIPWAWRFCWAASLERQGRRARQKNRCPCGRRWGS